jgi:tetratricopeptide (TPR) repeat protein
MRGRVLLRQSKFDESEAAFKKALDLNPDLVTPYLNLGSIYLAKDEGKEAISLYEGIIQERPRFVQAYVALGAIYEMQGNQQRALETYEKALQVNPGSAPAANNVAWILLDRGKDLKRAFDLASMAKERMPDDPRVAATLGRALIAEGLYSQAVNELTYATEAQPPSSELYKYLGLACWKSGDTDQARQAYHKAVEINPEDLGAWYELARLDRTEGRLEDASAHLDKLLALKPDYGLAMMEKVNIYIAQKQPAKAVSFLDEKLRRYEENTELAAALHEAKGAVLISHKKYEESEAAFKKAVELHPALISAQMSLAEVYIEKKETPKAIDAYNEVVKNSPKFIPAYMALGGIFRAEGKQIEARKMYEKALEINPDFAPAANNLAYLLLEQSEDLDRAFDLARKAKAQLPDDPSVADTLGLVYIAKGLYPNAISELSDAAAKRPENPTVLYHLGLAYWKNGDKDQALKTLQDALKVKAFPERQEAEKLLKEIEES